MNNEQLEAKLEQALTKRNAISEDISSLKENGTKADKEILRLYADLAALDEPEELVHGDYGLDCSGRMCIEIKTSDMVLTDVGDEHMYRSFGGAWHVETKLGNVFDDMKLLRKTEKKT